MFDLEMRDRVDGVGEIPDIWRCGDRHQLFRTVRNVLQMSASEELAYRRVC